MVRMGGARMRCGLGNEIGLMVEALGSEEGDDEAHFVMVLLELVHEALIFWP